MPSQIRKVCCFVLVFWSRLALVTEQVALDVTQLDADAEVRITAGGDGAIVVDWPAGGMTRAIARLRASGKGPLIESLALRATAEASPRIIARDLAPFFALTVGARNLDTPGGWTIFFDKVHQRPYQRYRAELKLESARAQASGTRGKLTFSQLTAGPFSGELVFSFFAGSPLILAEAVVRTSEDRHAIIYDAGLVARPDDVERFVWSDHDDSVKSQPAADAKGDERSVRYRTIVAQTSRGGAVAVFPPPHKFFYPLDFADNFGFNWLGQNYPSAPPGIGWGIRQPPEGDGRFVPWVNAPPGTSQRLGVFYLLSADGATEALPTVRRYTHSDRYPVLPGYKTFTSHYHIEHTLDLIKQQAASGTNEIPAAIEVPGFKRAFRTLGVDIVHLAEFHNGQTPKLVAAERLRQLRTLHAECHRLSDDQLLLIPGEEPNVHLGGHWISLFPRPVLWVLNRPAGIPFAQQDSTGETVYHVGSADDVLALVEREHGLMWTAHARIKSSVGFPDGYRDRNFFRSPRFLGAAWKAMPADYSHDTLGRRVLDLLDDMNQWGEAKQVLGEVDVFKVLPGYELYGHANINYLRLDELPRFADGWKSVLDSLRSGQFFTTTGEVLIPEFSVARSPGQPLTVRAQLQWTFPLAHAEIVGGDGAQVRRHRVALVDTKEFGRRELTVPLPPEFASCRWLRLEVWDIATNGAFTQPIHLQ